MSHNKSEIIKRYLFLTVGLFIMAFGVAFIFGYMTDFAIACLQSIGCNSYIQSWVFCLIGIVLVATGVSFEVVAKVVTLAGEGVVLAICKAWPRLKFGTIKVSFDVTLVCTAVILSLIFLHTVTGVREGTLAAALLVGTISRNINKILQPLVERFFKS